MRRPIVAVVARPMPHSRHSIIDDYYVELAYPFQVAASKLRNSFNSIAARTAPPTPMRDHVPPMTGESPSDVLGSLPRTRPHRRSQKRPPRVVDAGCGRSIRGHAGKGPRQPRRRPPRPSQAPPAPSRRACASPPSRRAPRRGRATARRHHRTVRTCSGPPSRRPRSSPRSASRSAPGRSAAPSRVSRALSAPAAGHNASARYVYFRAFQPSDRPSAGDRRGNHLRAARFAGANRSRLRP